jgi:archaetidylinositol phosphate synthase
MASKIRLRYIFKPLVTLIAKGLIKIKVTPNIATTIMMCFSLMAYFSLIIFQNLILFSIFVFSTGIMDGCDGAIARLSNKATKFGGFFDSFMDRISEFFIFLGLFFYNQNKLFGGFIDMKFIVLISFIFSIMISYCRARAEIFFRGDFDIGLMARSERLFYIVIASIIELFFSVMNIALFIFMFLVLATFIFRISKIYYKIERRERHV